MNVILTGASSFLGRAVTKELCARGVHVCALRHSFEEAETPLPETADAWIHFAWAGVGSAGRSDAGIQAFNIRMTMAALRKAASLHCRRFLFAGSQAEYGRWETGEHSGEGADAQEEETAPASKPKQTEETACRPVSEYGKAKLRVFREAYEWTKKRNAACDAAGHAEANMQYVHMRIFSVYGSGDHETSLVQTAVRAFRNDEPMRFGAAAQDWNYLHVSDAARAVCLLTEADGKQLAKKLWTPNAGSGVYAVNVAGAEIRPLRSYIEEMHAVCRSRSEMRYGSRADNAEGAVNLRPDTSRLRALGFREEISFADGIRALAGELGSICRC